MSGKAKFRTSAAEAVEALKKHGGNKYAASAALGMSYSTFCRYLEKREMPSGQTERDLAFYRRLAEAQQREIQHLQKIRKHVFELKDRKPVMPKWATRATRAMREVPVLFTSDFQWGEVIDSAELDGINEYNIDIARKRYRELISATIDICFNHQARTDYPGIIYLRGGDTVSGDIHEELIETNEVSSILQVFDVFCEEAEGIRKLADAFGRVVVISVPGNHGRLTRKPRAKRYVESNFDHLVSLMLERQFMHVMKDPRVEFHTPVSGDFRFPVYGTNMLLTHGDRIGSRGGQGFIGPAATVMRGVKKVRDQYAALGKPVDIVLLGHFHVAMELTHCIVNGALSGYSEFAMMLRCDPEPPSQTLFFVHPKWGVTQRRRLVLEDPEKMHANWFDRTS